MANCCLGGPLPTSTEQSVRPNQGNAKLHPYEPDLPLDGVKPLRHLAHPNIGIVQRTEVMAYEWLGQIPGATVSFFKALQFATADLHANRQQPCFLTIADEA